MAASVRSTAVSSATSGYADVVREIPVWVYSGDGADTAVATHESFVAGVVFGVTEALSCRGPAGQPEFSQLATPHCAGEPSPKGRSRLPARERADGWVDHQMRTRSSGESHMASVSVVL